MAGESIRVVVQAVLALLAHQSELAGALNAEALVRGVAGDAVVYDGGA